VIGDGGSAIHEPSQHPATQGHGGNPPSAGIGVGPGEGRRIADRYHERVSPGKLAVGAQTERTHRPVHQQPCSGTCRWAQAAAQEPPAFNLQKVAPRGRGIEWVGEIPLDPADHAGEAPESAGLRTRTVHSRSLGATPTTPRSLSLAPTAATWLPWPLPSLLAYSFLRRSGLPVLVAGGLVDLVSGQGRDAVRGAQA
jgi:hypothetical protein